MFDGVIRGWTNRRIAREMDITRATAKWHMHNVFAKTNTGNREGLLRLALTGASDESAPEPDPVPSKSWG